MSSTRREFLRRGWQLGGALLGAAAVWTTYESLRPLGASGAGGVIKLGNYSNYPKGTATYVNEGHFYVANADNHLFAISQKCPHLGCRVPFCESSGRFECPCHGSTFDIGGEWIQGPAPTGMTQYKLTLDGQNVVVDTSKTLPPPPRGAHAYLTPPKGPPCAQKG